MKNRWLITLISLLPLACAVVVLQSCGGEGGPVAGGGSGGGLPSPTAQFLALLPSAQAGSAYIGSTACVNGTCHGGGARGDGVVYEHWQQTKHFTANVGCERCHGPGSTHALNPTKANILTFPKLASAAVCGQCHGPIFDQWNFSKHSKLVASPVESMITGPASTRSSRCASCHSGLFRTQIVEGGVDVASLSDDVIRQLGRDTKDLVPHVATCSTCHNPHSLTGNLTDTGEDVQLRHKTYNEDTTAVAPGTNAASFTKMDHICAQCHNGRGTNPSDTSLTSGASRPSMHDSNQYNMLLGLGGVVAGGSVTPANTAHASIPGQCSKCHMPDSTHAFTVSYDKSCSPCHTVADAAARVRSTKDDMVNQLFALRTRMEDWAFARFGNRDFWDYTSLIDAEYGTGSAPAQTNVPIQVKRARHNYYFVVRDSSYGVHNGPYGRHLVSIGNVNMDAVPVPSRGSNPRLNLSVAQKLEILQKDRQRAGQAELTAEDE